jgi:hypothetical protein
VARPSMTRRKMARLRPAPTVRGETTTASTSIRRAMAGVLDGGGWELCCPKQEGGDASSAARRVAALATAADTGERGHAYQG